MAEQNEERGTAAEATATPKPPPSTAFEDTPATGDATPAAGGQGKPPAPAGAQSASGAASAQGEAASASAPAASGTRDRAARKHMREHPSSGAAAAQHGTAGAPRLLARVRERLARPR